jgi:hypothetical protein
MYPVISERRLLGASPRGEEPVDFGPILWLQTKHTLGI